MERLLYLKLCVVIVNIQAQLPNKDQYIRFCTADSRRYILKIIGQKFENI